MNLSSTINHAALWQRRVRLESFVFRATSLDRLVYLWLHKLKLMGRERSHFAQHIKPGMTVVDIGANIGVYALYFGSLVRSEGRVFAFEPEPRLHVALRENIETNHAANVIPFAKALGSRAGMLPIRTHGLNSGDTSLTSNLAGPNVTRVEVVTLDEALQGERIDFVKMDVQGWEPEVFRGMKQLMKCNPAARIHFEFMPYGLRRAGFIPADLLDYLSEEGWQVTTMDGRPFTKNDAALWDDGGKRFTNLFATQNGPVPS